MNKKNIIIVVTTVLLLLAIVAMWFKVSSIDTKQELLAERDDILLLDNINNLRDEIEKDTEIIYTLQERVDRNKELKDCYQNNLNNLLNNEQYNVSCISTWSTSTWSVDDFM